MSDLTRLPLWPFILILGYPIVAIAVLEFGRRLTSRAPFTSGILRQVAYVLLPTGAMRLILRVLAGLPANDSAVRLAETAFALTGLYLLLHVAQAALTRLLDQQMRAPMPRKSDWRRAYETDILRRNHATKVANSSEHHVDEA